MATARADVSERSIESRWADYFNESIERGALLERVKTALSLQALREWRRYRFRIIEQAQRFDGIAGRGQSATRQRNVERIIGRMRELAAEGVGAARGAIVPDLRSLARSEAAWIQRRLDDLLPRISLDRYDARTIGRIVKTEIWGGSAGAQTLDQWFDGISRDAQRLIETRVKAGVIAGESTPDIVARLRRARGGVLNTIGHNIEAVSHTATQAISQAVRREVAQQLPAQAIRQEIWSATLDLRTCPSCASLDGRRWPMGRGPYPPIHPRCRCNRLVVPLGLDLSKVERAGRDGPVRADMSFREWLSQRSIEDQNRVLGKRRAELWRQGKLDDLDPRTVLDANHRPIPVRDLDALSR